jgi:hypothetical protein
MSAQRQKVTFIYGTSRPAPAQTDRVHLLPVSCCLFPIPGIHMNLLAAYSRTNLMSSFIICLYMDADGKK